MRLSTQRIIDEMSTVIQTFDDSISLTINASTESVDYLDLTMMVHDDRIFTKTYRKPTFSAQYIPSWSFRRSKCFDGILKTEMFRFVVNTDFANDYLNNVKLLLVNLSLRGLPMTNIDSYDASRRDLVLDAVASRRIRERDEDVVNVVLDHHQMTDTIPIAAIIKDGFSELQLRSHELKDLRLQVAYKSFCANCFFKIAGGIFHSTNTV